MKLLLLSFLIACSAYAAEPKPEFKYDPNSPEALASKAKNEGYEREGQALQTYDLYKELLRLDAARKFRMSMATQTEVLLAMLTITDDDMRSWTYVSMLKKRGESGDAYASFYYAVREWDSCSRYGQEQGDALNKMAKECWQGLMPAFKRASDAQIAAASFNIGRLYEHGFGVTPSKLVAAEWYVKSADQHNKFKDRDNALTALESALNLVPDHPAGLRMRRAMLK
jgi:tetratricopeptide (TPR) repeat protein